MCIIHGEPRIFREKGPHKETATVVGGEERKEWPGAQVAPASCINQVTLTAELKLQRLSAPSAWDTGDQLFSA